MEAKDKTRERLIEEMEALRRKLKETEAKYKQAEEELRKTREELERRVEECTAELVKSNALMGREINERLVMEEAVAHVSRLFISSKSTDLREVLKVLGEAASANRAYIFQFRENGKKMDNTYEWCAAGTEPQIDNLQDLDSAIFPWWMKKLAHSENIVIQNVDALPPDASAEKEILQAQGICSLLVVPIYSTTGTLVGFMGFDDTEKCRGWSSGNIQVLRVVAEMVGAYWERKRMEESLRESQQKYRTIFEKTGTAIMILEEDTTISMINSECEELIGYSKKEVEGKKSWTELVAKDDLEKMKKYHYLRRIDPNAAPKVYDFQLVNKQGDVKNILLTVSMIPGTKKSTVSLSDITKRKQAERTLQEHSLFLQRLIDTIPNPIYYKDVHGIYQGCNKAFESFIGLTKEDIVGKSVYEVSPKDLADEYYEMDSALFREPGVQVYESSVLYADGSRHDVIFNKATYSNTDGTVAGLVGVVIDITERKRVEERLQTVNRQLSDIIEFLPDATFVIDRDKKVIAWNRAIEEMTGVHKDYILGKGDYAYAVPFYGKPRPILIDLIFMDDMDTELKYDYIERKEATLYAEAFTPSLFKGKGAFLRGKASPLFDSMGNIVGAIESMRDVTYRKQTEAELQKAKEAAEAASQAKSQFLANMSHEIRTPMNAIIGMTELLLNTPLSDEQQDFASTIYDSGQLLLTIINDILDLSKMEAGKLSLEKVEFEPVSLIEGVAKLMEVKAREKNLLMKTFIDKSIPPLLCGDTVRLRQILFNLVGNAVKFTESGEVVLRASVISEDGSRNIVRFEVTDTGIGMSQKDCSKLFQAFSQVDGTITRRYGGTGLGLAISNQLVKLMGGEIGVKSVKGKGSTFWFTLPFEHPLAAHAPGAGTCLRKIEPDQVPPAVPGAASNANTDRLILLAEDNPVNRKLTIAQLNKLGYSAQTVANGREAVEAALTGRYALILMDCQMPEMDGFEATRTIRKAEIALGRRIPIVALTAYAMQDDLEKCISAGMDDFLKKPVGLEQLRVTIGQWLPPGGMTREEMRAVQLSPTKSPEPDAIDPDTLEGLYQLQEGPDLLGDLIDIYLRDTPPRIAALREAVRKRDPEALVFPSHSVKSSSANMGALALADMCGELEIMGRAGVIEGAAEKVSRVESEYKRVCRALAAACRKGESVSEKSGPK